MFINIIFVPFLDIGYEIKSLSWVSVHGKKIFNKCLIKSIKLNHQFKKFSIGFNWLLFRIINIYLYDWYRSYVIRQVLEIVCESIWYQQAPYVSQRSTRKFYTKNKTLHHNILVDINIFNSESVYNKINLTDLLFKIFCHRENFNVDYTILLKMKRKIRKTPRLWWMNEYIYLYNWLPWMIR